MVIPEMFLEKALHVSLSNAYKKLHICVRKGASFLLKLGGGKRRLKDKGPRFFG
jgi:hypothetical protein